MQPLKLLKLLLFVVCLLVNMITEKYIYRSLCTDFTCQQSHCVSYSRCYIYIQPFCNICGMLKMENLYLFMQTNEMSKKRSFSKNPELGHAIEESHVLSETKRRKLNASLLTAEALSDTTKANLENQSSRCLGNDHHVAEGQDQDVNDGHSENRLDSNNGSLNTNSGNESHVASESDLEDDIILLFAPFEKLSIDE